MSDSPEDQQVVEALPPVYSVVKDGRLVAYARRALPEGGGAVRRASGKEPRILHAIAYGVVDCFDSKAAPTIVAKAQEVETLDALLFELKLEGFDVHEGEAKPNGSRWTF
ncbi:MAG: hypothetical protein ACAI38_05125 [Myxococcota bacterium]